MASSNNRRRDNPILSTVQGALNAVNPMSNPSGTAKLVAAVLAYKLYSSYSRLSAEEAAIRSELEHRVPIPAYQSYIVPGTENIPGQTAIHRSAFSADKLVSTHFDDVRTLYDNFQRGARLFPTRPFLGTRQVDSNGVAGRFVWETYSDVNRRLTSLGSGFLRLGLKQGEFVGVYSQNRAEWVIAAEACNAYSMVSVTLYDTLGANAVGYIIEHSSLPCVVCSGDKVDNVLQAVEGKPTSLRLLVCMDETITDAQKRRAEVCGIQLYSMKYVEDVGRKNPYAHQPPSPDDLATICYTSGTTGTPKGAMLLHKNLIGDAAGFLRQPNMVQITEDDVHISYLPLAHMFERVMHLTVYCHGASIGFFQGDVTKLLDDIVELKPTIFPSVPRLFNRIYDKILTTVNSGSAIKRSLFNAGFNAKLKLLQEQGSVRSPFWDSLVFKKVAAALGGRVRLMVTGSAPIAGSVIDFLRICFSCEVIEGYGQTEGTAAVTSTLIGDYKTDHVGAPLLCCEVKLVDVPEMEYTSKDKPFPRGEVCSRGINIFPGYYKDPEKTEEALDSDGWLHSGDIGMWTAEGTLKIIDRKKNIFKLAQGEYIAPEKIENVYARSPYVMQSFVYGDSLQSHLVAVVVPDAENLAAWAQNQGKSDDIKALCKDPDVVKLIADDMLRIAKEAQLKGFEMVREIELEPEPFSVENESLTPTFKLKRNVMKKKYQATIEKLYGKNASKL